MKIIICFMKLCNYDNSSGKFLHLVLTQFACKSNLGTKYIVLDIGLMIVTYISLFLMICKIYFGTCIELKVKITFVLDFEEYHIDFNHIIESCRLCLDL